MEVIVIILLNDHLYSIEVSVITLLYDLLYTLWRRMLEFKASKKKLWNDSKELIKNDKKLINN